MAEVKYNATLENKANTIVLTHHDELGGIDPFHPDTKMYIKHMETEQYINLDTGNFSGTSEVGYGTASGNVFTCTVDLSNIELDVNYDYDHPVYEYTYSIRYDLANVYMYGKLNIVNIA